MLTDPAAWVDGIIGVLVIEVLVLSTRMRVRRGLPGLRALLPNLAAGLFLVLALRCAIHQQGPAAIGAFLALGGLAHLLDLRSRSR